MHVGPDVNVETLAPIKSALGAPTDDAEDAVGKQKRLRGVVDDKDVDTNLLTEMELYAGGTVPAAEFHPDPSAAPPA